LEESVVMDEIQNYTLKDQPLSLPLHDRTRPLAESNKPRLALSQEEHPRGDPGPPSADEQITAMLSFVNAKSSIS